MTGLDLAFATTGLITAAAAALAVTTRHVVHSALWLVVALLGLAGCYLVLGAELVALVQVLVYVGAVVVLVIVALMLTRAPILVPLQRFQSALIVRFVDNADRPGHGIGAPVALVAGIGAAGAVAAWLIGPWIMRLLFAPAMQVPGPILGVLTLGAAATGMLMITGTTTLAAGRHSRYVVGWVTATAVAFACLPLPLPVATTVCIALIVGPAAGIAVHAPAILTDERKTT